MKRLRGVAFETRAVVRFKPVERAARLRVTGTYQPDSGGTALDITFTGNPNGTWTIFFADMAFAAWRQVHLPNIFATIKMMKAPKRPPPARR